MRLSSSQQRPPKRKGVILLVVLTMMALFAVIGLSFVLYSESRSNSSRIWRESQSFRLGEEPPWTYADSVFNSSLGDLIFDCGDDAGDRGVFSALRGHSLARGVYGWNYTATIDASHRPTYTSLANDTPWNGVGWDYRQPGSKYGPPEIDPTPTAINPNALYGPNFQYFGYATGATPAPTATTEALRYPERSGYQSVTGMTPFGHAIAQVNTLLPTVSAMTFTGKNAGHTAADLSNLFLARVDANGNVTEPSFHRSWIFGSLATTNPNWTNVRGRYLSLRPRPVDQVDLAEGINASEFPYPEDTGGDVKNLEHAPGGNDSIWLDLDLPVRFWNNKYYKPLVAMLILDLDKRVNLNTAGNLRGSNPMVPSVSNQGFGPWEVNPLRLGIAPPEFVALLQGSGSTQGRYGTNHVLDFPLPIGAPGFATNPQGMIPLAFNPLVNYHSLAQYGVTANLPLPPFSSLIDYDGNATSNIAAALGAPMRSALPFDLLAGAGYNNGIGTTLPGGEATQLPHWFNPYFRPSEPIAGATPNDDRRFAVSELRKLSYKYNAEDSVVYPTSDIATLAPNTYGAAAPRRNAFMVTTLSNDIDRPAWAKVPGTSEVINPVHPTDQRSAMARLGAVNLNRKLTDYRNDETQYFTSANVRANPNKATLARYERHCLARDIFTRICVAMGEPVVLLRNAVSGDIFAVPNPTVAPGTPPYDRMRVWAQLAANMVDFIDTDDVMTTFVWNPVIGAPLSVDAFGIATVNIVGSDSNPLVNALGMQDPVAVHPNNPNFAPGAIENRVVFGTERNRLVINESFLRVENDPTDPSLMPPDPMMPKASRYVVKIWTELHNPLTPQDNPNRQDLAQRYGAALVDNHGMGLAPVYQLLIARQTANLTLANNVTGAVAPADIERTIPVLTDTAAMPVKRKVQPNYSGSYTQHAPTTLPDGTLAVGSFYVIGPPPPTDPANTFIAPYPDNLLPGMAPTNLNPDFTSDQMQYTVNVPAQLQANGMPAPPKLVLQRLADPYHAHHPQFNPWITVDYVEFTNADNGDTVASAPADFHEHMNFAAKYNDVGLANVMMAGKPQTKPNGEQRAVGRQTPLAGFNPVTAMANTQTLTQLISATPVGNEVHHTFHRHNGPTPAPGGPSLQFDPNFDHFVHLDRPLVSVIEAMQVGFYKPHEFTHRFAVSDGMGGRLRFQHLNIGGISWTSNGPGQTLYRVLEFFTINGWTAGSGHGGRVPGRINVNTVTEQEVFNALVDPQPGNLFTPAEANTVVTTMNGARFTTDSALPGGPIPNSYHAFGEATQIGSPLFGAGIARTLLNGHLQVNTATTPNPYFHKELLSKIRNNATTRSNTFAVWMTIGYFEVRNYNPNKPWKTWDPAKNRYHLPILGRELYLNGPGDLRNKFFAIIDRTAITVDPSNPRQIGPLPVTFASPHAVPDPDVLTGAKTSTGPMQITITVPATSNVGGRLQGIYDDTRFDIGPGTPMVVDYGLNEEIVNVAAVSYDPASRKGTIILNPCTRAHQQGVPVSLARLGNPGPQANFRYDDSRYAAIVRYVTQIR